MLVGIALGLLVTSASTGVLYLPEESRYFDTAHQLLLSIWGRFAPIHDSHLDFTMLWGNFARSPMGAILNLPIVALSWLQHSINPQTASIESIGKSADWFTLPLYLNIACYAIASRLIYKIAERCFHESNAGILAQGLFLLWPQHLIYMRHILPYLLSEVLLLAAGFHLVKLLSVVPDLQTKMPLIPASEPGARLRETALQCGFWWAASFLVYPGFGYSAIVFAAVFLTQPLSLRYRLHQLARFLLPGITALVVLEALSRLYFSSTLLETLFTPATTQSLQAPIDGWGMPWAYATAMSPPVTILTVFAILMPFAQWAWRRMPHTEKLTQSPLGINRISAGIDANPDTAQADAADELRLEHSRHRSMRMAGLAMMLYAALCLVSSGLQLTPLYGRTLIPLLLVCLILLAGLCGRQMFLRRNSVISWTWIGFVASALCVTSLLPNFARVLNLQYPQDLQKTFFRQTGVNLPDPSLDVISSANAGLRIEAAGNNASVVLTRTAYSDPRNAPKTFNCRSLGMLPLNPVKDMYVVLNRQTVSPIQSLATIDPLVLSSGAVLYDQPQPITFSAYQYEGPGKPERTALHSAPLDMMILKNPCRHLPIQLFPTTDPQDEALTDDDTPTVRGASPLKPPR